VPVPPPSSGQHLEGAAPRKTTAHRVRGIGPGKASHAGESASYTRRHSPPSWPMGGRHTRRAVLHMVRAVACLSNAGPDTIFLCNARTPRRPGIQDRRTEGRRQHQQRQRDILVWLAAPGVFRRGGLARVTDVTMRSDRRKTTSSILSDMCDRTSSLQPLNQRRKLNKPDAGVWTYGRYLAHSQPPPVERWRRGQPSRSPPTDRLRAGRASAETPPSGVKTFFARTRRRAMP